MNCIDLYQLEKKRQISNKVCINWKYATRMGSSPSNRVSAVSLQKEQESSCKGCEKLKDFEIRANELERTLENSQQKCLEVEAQHRQASDELEMLREELERLNKQVADSRASSASERATKQV